MPTIDLPAAMQALHDGSVEALRQVLAQDPMGIAGMDHPPYKFAIRAIDQNAGRDGQPEQQRQAKDQLLMALVEVIHTHAGEKQNSSRELRLAAEMAAGRGYAKTAMRLMDLGAPLTNNVGKEILRDVWANPNEAIHPDRARAWKSSATLERQTWEHRVICTMALAGAEPAALEAFSESMRSPISAKLMSQAFWHMLANHFTRQRVRGRENCLGATPASTLWLSGKMGSKGLQKTLDEINPDAANMLNQTVSHLRAQLQSAQMDQTTMPVSRSRGARL